MADGIAVRLDWPGERTFKKFVSEHPYYAMKISGEVADGLAKVMDQKARGFSLPGELYGTIGARRIRSESAHIVRGGLHVPGSLNWMAVFERGQRAGSSFPKRAFVGPSADSFNASGAAREIVAKQYEAFMKKGIK